MGKGSKFFILSGALHLLHTAAALFIIIVVPWKLYHADLSANANGTAIPVDFTSKCLLDPGTTSKTWSGAKFCVGITGFAVAMLILGAVVSLVECCCKCITANALKLSHVIRILGDIAIGVFWALLLSTLVPRANAADKAGYPRHGYREGVVITAAVAMASMFLDVLVNVFGMVKGMSG